MDSEKLRISVGNNIAARRRIHGLTQAELAQKLNYSDKAVSKWERGESLPDLVTLVQLSELFGVSIDALISQEKMKAIPKHHKKQVNKTVIQMLVSLLVWFVALSVYVVLSSTGIPKSWISFFYAVPINAIVLLCLRSAWRKYNRNHLLISLIVWGTLLALYVTMLVFAHVNLWRLFLLGLAGQAAVTLWFFLFRKEAADG